MIALPRPEEWDFLEPSRPTDEPGRLGPYRVLEVLGVGGMGLVFRAEDTQLRRPVALKVLRQSLAACAAVRERFLREARVAAAVEHDHVVPIWHVGEDRGTPFIAMPLLRGEPLDRRLDREGRLPPPEVLRIGREACRGLAAAHARGVVHCDVKPANIWLETPAGEPRGSATGGRVKLLDFGLARAAGDVMDWACEDTSGGTPSYMAPEQSRGAGVDARADLFSLGCVLYHMATGERPFKGSDSMATLIAAAVDQPTPPVEIKPELPPALSGLILRLLAKDPADRPPSAGAVALELEAIERQAKEGVSCLKKGASAARAVPPPLPTRRRWYSPMIAAAVLLVPGPVGPTRPGPAPPTSPRRTVAAPLAITPAPASIKAGPGVDRHAEANRGDPGRMVRRRVEVSGAITAVEQQRNAVGLEILRAQVDLGSLDRRLGQGNDPAARKSAVEGDDEVGVLRTRLAKARDVLDEYRSRGYSLSLPTPAALARTVSKLEARLEQRVRIIEDDLRSRADDREALDQARLELVHTIEALRKVYDGLQADLDRLNARKPADLSLRQVGVVHSP
jgi:serine/threonine protein kinase